MSDCSVFYPSQESIEKLEKERGKKQDIIEDKTVSKWALANGMINGQTSSNYKYKRMNQEINESITYRKSIDWRPNDRPSHGPTDKPTGWTNKQTSVKRIWKWTEGMKKWRLYYTDDGFPR